MNIARTIVAVLIAVSVALLPATRGFAVTAKSANAMAEMSTSDDATMSDMSIDMSDCCPKVNPCGKGTDDCASMAGCALKCFSFSNTAFSLVVFSSIPADLIAPYASAPLRSPASSPPFRPPRV
jgi:hypothetical protein